MPDEPETLGPADVAPLTTTTAKPRKAHHDKMLDRLYLALTAKDAPPAVTLVYACGTMGNAVPTREALAAVGRLAWQDDRFDTWTYPDGVEVVLLAGQDPPARDSLPSDAAPTVPERPATLAKGYATSDKVEDIPIDDLPGEEPAAEVKTLGQRIDEAKAAIAEPIPGPGATPAQAPEPAAEPKPAKATKAKATPSPAPPATAAPEPAPSPAVAQLAQREAAERAAPPAAIRSTQLPSAMDLYLREDLLPREEISDRLAEAIKGTHQYMRKSTVTATYNVTWDDETQRLSVDVAVKAKRPVKLKRNEEVIGDEMHLFSIVQEVPGQQRLPGSDHHEPARRSGKDAAAGD